MFHLGVLPSLLDLSGDIATQIEAGVLRTVAAILVGVLAHYYLSTEPVEEEE